MYGPTNRILTSGNIALAVTNLDSIPTTTTLNGVPLGTADGSATGEVGAKVVLVGGSAGATANQVQGNAADNAVSTGNPVYVGGLAVTGATYAPAYAVGDRAALAVDKDSGGLLVVTQNPKGAPNYANGQVATSTTAATLVAARATRRSVLVVNNDATILVYVGAATVTASTGLCVKPANPVTLETTALIQVIAASGTPSVSYLETYD